MQKKLLHSKEDKLLAKYRKTCLKQTVSDRNFLTASIQIRRKRMSWCRHAQLPIFPSPIYWQESAPQILLTGK